MNQQIPDYSAVYSNQQPVCPMYRPPLASSSAAVPQTMPVGQQTAPKTPAQPISAGTDTSMAPLTSASQPMPVTADSTEYLNGFLRTQIGRRMRVEFLLGTNTFTDKSGLLIGVGANYILLRESSTDDIIACDFYNIKFITFFY